MTNKKILILSIFGLFGVILTASAFWQSPPGTPETPNVPEPINVTSSEQEKEGTLNLGENLYISNRVGIGTMSPQAPLDIRGDILAGGDINLGSNSLDGSGFYLAHNGTRRLRMWSGYLRPTGSNFDLGRSSSSRRFRTVYSHNVDTGQVDVSGDISAGGSVTASAFYYSSDKKAKENLRPLEGGLDKISELEAVRFNWKNSKEESFGLLAQDVERVFPEAVIDDGGKFVDYAQLVAPLIQSVNQQQKEIDSLNQEIEELREMIENK